MNINLVFKIPDIHIFIHNAEQDAETVKKLEDLGKKIDAAEAKMQNAVDDAAKK